MKVELSEHDFSTLVRGEHIYLGRCPDRVEGWKARDKDCPLCRLLIRIEKEMKKGK